MLRGLANTAHVTASSQPEIMIYIHYKNLEGTENSSKIYIFEECNSDIILLPGVVREPWYVK